MIVDTGYDLICKATSDTATQPAAANRIGVTASAVTPAAGHTTLSGEITTGGAGLLRAQAAFAKSSTKVYTLIKTFTINGTDTIPVTLQAFGVFNAASAGTMLIENTISPTATLSAIGDALTITDTVTLT